MAQKVNIVLVDDLTGDELKDGETVTFGLDGQTWEIDLSKKNADKLRGALQDYIAVGRKVGSSRTGRRSSGGSKRDNSETHAIKAWADEQGIDYPQRGRLPQTLIDQYRQAKG